MTGLKGILRLLSKVPIALPFLLAFLVYQHPLVAVAEVKEEIRFGVFAYKGVEKTIAQYAPIVRYLNNVLPEYSVSLHVLSLNELEEWIDNSRLDFVTTNPTHYLVVRHKYPLTGVLATLVSRDPLGMPVFYLGGVILTRPDRNDINTLKDIKNKTVATPSTKHMGGYRAQVYELAMAGVEPGQYRVIETKIHQEAIRALLRGEVDVAFVRTGIVEEMIRDGEITIEQIKVINNHGFERMIVSTRLYPEWPVFALHHLDERKKRRFTSALFSIEPDYPAAIEAGIYGYTIPLDYRPVEELAKKLRLPPFENYGVITPKELLKQYWHTIVFISILMSALVILFVRERRLKNVLSVEIQERKRTEAQRQLAYEALRQERDLFSEGPVVTMIWKNSENWPVEYVSKNVTKVLGYTEEELLSEDTRYSDFIHPDDLQRVSDELSYYLSNNINFFEQFYRLRLKDGSYRWFYDFTMTVRDSNNMVTSFKGYLLDQTRQKEAEINLVRERERLDNIIRGTNAGTWEWNVQTGEVVFNNRAVEMIGYTQEELEPLDIHVWIRHIHEEDRDNRQKTLESHLLGKSEYYNCEYRMMHKNGHLIWVIDRGKVATWTEDAKPLMMMGTLTDITERKRIEEALIRENKRAAENEERLLAFINAIPDIVCYKDGQGRWLLANDADLELFQLRDVDYFGKTDAELSSFTHQIYKDAFNCCMQTDEIAWQKGVVSKGIEKIPTVDGVVKIYDVYKVPLFNADGSRRGLAVIGRDVTDLFNTQQELVKAKEQAESATKAKSQFLANMSHEIRTPLNAVIGYTDLLTKTPLNELQRQYVGYINTAGKLLLDIISDILDLSKIESESLELEYVEIDLWRLIHDVLDIVKVRAFQKGLELLLNMPDGIPQSIKSDPTRIKQVLNNLLNNAIKFTEKGEVELSVSLDQRDHKDGDVWQKGLLHFRVRDTGIGISEGDKERIFKAFAQADLSTTRQYGGTGLGLTIS
ncbi:MAG: PAS domain-containing protein, partial [Thermodesulfovibrionales bacterium]